MKCFPILLFLQLAQHWEVSWGNPQKLAAGQGEFPRGKCWCWTIQRFWHKSASLLWCRDGLLKLLVGNEVWAQGNANLQSAGRNLVDQCGDLVIHMLVIMPLCHSLKSSALSLNSGPLLLSASFVLLKGCYTMHSRVRSSRIVGWMRTLQFQVYFIPETNFEYILCHRSFPSCTCDVSHGATTLIYVLKSQFTFKPWHLTFISQRHISGAGGKVID